MSWLDTNKVLEKVDKIRSQHNPVAFFETQYFDKKGKLISTTYKRISGRDNINIVKNQLRKKGDRRK